MFSLRRLLLRRTQTVPFSTLRRPPAAAAACGGTLDRQFQSTIESLPPNFTPSDLSSALESIGDPDLAFDLFRWASLRPHFQHSPASYHSILVISVSSRRLSRAVSLADEALSLSALSLPLLHTILRLFTSPSHPHLLNHAFDAFLRMPQLNLSPSLETFSILLRALLLRLRSNRLAYMHPIRSLIRRMRAARVVPDTAVSNLIIKAHVICLELDDAMRVFREMRPLYGCQPDDYTYGCLARGMCEKGRGREGMAFYREMKGRGMVPAPAVSMVLVNCLAMEGSFDQAVEVVRDMVANGKRPDLITWRTLLEGMWRGGRGAEATELLEEMRREGGVAERCYYDLVDGIRWLKISAR